MCCERRDDGGHQFSGRKKSCQWAFLRITPQAIDGKRKYSPIAPLEKLAVGVEDKTEGILSVIGG